MIYLVLLFTILFFTLAWRRLDLAVMFLIAALPAYLIRFSIFGLPSTILEVMIWIVFLVWFFKNFSQIINNFLENFKKEKKKTKIRYPFGWEMVLLLLVALLAVAVAGFNLSALGIWKAYFFEPVLFFIVVLNIMKGEKGREKILWSLAISALIVSVLAIYQKITGQLIDNSLWAAVSTRRVVSFFGYPNAVGLYLGPIILVMLGWLFSVIARSSLSLSSSGERQRDPGIHTGEARNNLDSLPTGQAGRLRGNDKGEGVARNDIIAVVFISLTIIASVLSIYFAKSKGALLGVAVGVAVFGLLANKKARWATVAVVLIMASSIMAYQPVRQIALDTINFKTLSGQIRKVGFEETWKMLKDGRLVTGAGLANFKSAIAPYHAEGFFIKNDDPNWLKKIRVSAEYRKQMWQPLEIYLYPHNIILNFWSELGLAGLLLFAWIIGKYFYLGIRVLSLRASERSEAISGSHVCEIASSSEYGLLAMTEKFLAIGLICAMVVIVVHGLVDVLYFKNDLAVMFWLLVAMMGIINLEIKYERNL